MKLLMFLNSFPILWLDPEGVRLDPLGLGPLESSLSNDVDLIRSQVAAVWVMRMVPECPWFVLLSRYLKGLKAL